MAVSSPVMAKCHYLKWQSVDSSSGKVTLPINTTLSSSFIASFARCHARVLSPIEAKCQNLSWQIVVTKEGKVSLPIMTNWSSQVKAKCCHISKQSTTSCHGKMSTHVKAKCHYLSWLIIHHLLWQSDGMS